MQLGRNTLWRQVESNSWFNLAHVDEDKLAKHLDV